MATAFETEVCGRCGGSGQYSYCQMYGTTCFGCAGSGKRLTKRGAAARAYFLSLRTIPAIDVVPGMTVISSGRKFKVLEVKITDSNCHLISAKCNYYLLLTSTVIAIPTSIEVGQDQLNRALAYQETLTKTGKPRKRIA